MIDEQVDEYCGLGWVENEEIRRMGTHLFQEGRSSKDSNTLDCSGSKSFLCTFDYHAISN